MTITGSQEVFDTKVEPFSLTCLGFYLDFTIVFSERDIHVSERVSCNMNLGDSTLYPTMQCETIPTPIQPDFYRLGGFPRVFLFVKYLFNLNPFARERHPFVFLYTT